MRVSYYTKSIDIFSYLKIILILPYICSILGSFNKHVAAT